MLKATSRADATGKTKWIATVLEKSLGAVPNPRRTLADSLAGLNAYIRNASAKTRDPLFPAGRSTSQCLS